MTMQKKQFRTSVLIDDDEAPFNDLQFIQARGLKPTNLLRSKIKELREKEEGAPSVEGMQQAMKNMQDRFSKMTDFLEDKGLIDEFLESKNI